MNLAQMREQVRTVARDTAGGFIADEDITSWLNEAQRDLAARLRSLQKSVGGTVGANSTFSLPSDLLSVHSLRLTGQTVPVVYADDDTWASWSDAGGTPIPSIYRIFGGSVVIFPSATGTAYTLEYEYAPPDLAEGIDVSLLPLPLHPKMVNYARAHALYKGNDTGLGDRYLGMYEAGLPQVSISNPRRVSTPLTLAYQRGPFDVDNYWDG